MTAEQTRLDEARKQKATWKKWGPYLSERQWGTVREDYSENGDAWNYFTHDQARSRAYRWGEDGLAGISDDQQRLCFALALWNGKDPILKERLFGLTNSESNHGEDVKEYYFYLDSTPTHSYMKYLYKYPQAAFPYADLVETSRRRSRNEFEYELLDTGVFDQDRYFDVFVEYAKDSPDDILIQISVHNRGPRHGRAACPADALVPQPVVLADHFRPADARTARRRLDPFCHQGRRSQAGDAVPLLRRRRAATVHGERNQHAADLRRAKPQPVRQRQHQRLRRARARSGCESREAGYESGSSLPTHGEPWRMLGRSASAQRHCARCVGSHERQEVESVRQPVRRCVSSAAKGGR